MAVTIFLIFVSSVLAMSFYLGAKTKSAKSYYAAGGGIHWFVNGIAFAGDYLSAASFLGICGMIAFFGYDGFLYSIGYLAGWVVALFVIAEPLKRMGRFTFADALDSRFNSRGIKLAAAISTLVVSIFYLIPQMVGAGALVQPLLHWPHVWGVVSVGVAVTVIVVTAGMVSTTYVQFIKGSLLVFFCTILTVMILNHGVESTQYHTVLQSDLAKRMKILPAESAWKTKQYIQAVDADGRLTIWQEYDRKQGPRSDFLSTVVLSEMQFIVEKDGVKTEHGLAGASVLSLKTRIGKLPGDAKQTGPLGPAEFLSTFSQSQIVQWIQDKEKIKDADGSVYTIYYPKIAKGSSLLLPGEKFKGIRDKDKLKKLDFLSLMLALFCGTASLPHILIRYYTVKDKASARKSTVVGIASIGFFYVLTLYLGIGAMTSGALESSTDSNMSAPLLARTFGEFLFAVISAIAFTTVLGTVSGLIMAASGAVVHDYMVNFRKMEMNDHDKVRAGKIVAVFVGIIAMALGIIFKAFNVTFLVGWAFNVAASANLPSLVMLLFWKGTTKQGITAAIFAGMTSSLAWILLSADTYRDVYHIDPEKALMPFSQPAIVTIPLGFIVLVAVSLATQKTGTAQAVANSVKAELAAK